MAATTTRQHSHGIKVQSAAPTVSPTTDYTLASLAAAITAVTGAWADLGIIITVKPPKLSREDVDTTSIVSDYKGRDPGDVKDSEAMELQVQFTESQYDAVKADFEAGTKKLFKITSKSGTLIAGLYGYIKALSVVTDDGKLIVCDVTITIDGPVTNGDSTGA